MTRSRGNSRLTEDFALNLGRLKTIILAVTQDLRIEYGDSNRRNNLLTEDFALNLSRLDAIGSAAAQDLCTNRRDHTRRKDVLTKYLTPNSSYLSTVGRTTPQHFNGCTSRVQPLSCHHDRESPMRHGLCEGSYMLNTYLHGRNLGRRP